MLSLKHNSLSQPLNSDLRLIFYLWISCLQGVVGIVVKFFFSLSVEQTLTHGPQVGPCLGGCSKNLKF